MFNLMSFDICEYPRNHHLKQNGEYVITPESFFMLPYCRFYPTSKYNNFLTSFIHLFLLLHLLFFLLLHFTFTDSSSACVCACVCVCVCMYLLSSSILDIHITVLISSSSFSLLRFMIWLYCSLFTHSLVNGHRGIPVWGCYE